LIPSSLSKLGLNDQDLKKLKKSLSQMLTKNKVKDQATISKRNSEENLTKDKTNTAR
jgi:hypothetical protein